MPLGKVTGIIQSGRKPQLEHLLWFRRALTQRSFEMFYMWVLRKEPQTRPNWEAMASALYQWGFPLPPPSLCCLASASVIQPPLLLLPDSWSSEVHLEGWGWERGRSKQRCLLPTASLASSVSLTDPNKDVQPRFPNQASPGTECEGVRASSEFVLTSI